MLIFIKSTDLVSSEPAFIEWQVRFTMVTLKHLPDQGSILVIVFVIMS